MDRTDVTLIIGLFTLSLTCFVGMALLVGATLIEVCSGVLFVIGILALLLAIAGLFCE